MNRSIRSIRRTVTLVVAMFALTAIVPAFASAQSITPTDQEYTPVVTSNGGGSQLPFTGLDAVALAAVGIGIVGAGFVVRRASRAGDDGLAE
jgi:hypothetical protein